MKFLGRAIGILAILGIVVLGWRAVYAQSTSVLVATILPNPLSIFLSIPANVLLNQTFKVTADVSNQGPNNLSDVQVSLFLPNGLVFANGSKQIIKLGHLPPFLTKQASWKVIAKASGSYILLSQAQALLNNQTLQAEATAVVNVSPSSFSRHNFFSWFAFLSEMF